MLRDIMQIDKNGGCGGPAHASAATLENIGRLLSPAEQDRFHLRQAAGLGRRV